jgi:alkaline phosphatase D
MGIAIHKVVRRNVLTARFDPAQLNFTHGVASGDPYPDSVILVRGSFNWFESLANCP